MITVDWSFMKTSNFRTAYNIRTVYGTGTTYSTRTACDIGYGYDGHGVQSIIGVHIRDDVGSGFGSDTMSQS